jgi:hypothetical protein
MSAQRFTVEELRDLAQRPALSLAHPALLYASAVTEKVEQMREWLAAGAAGDDAVVDETREQIDFLLFQFNRLFPKDGGQ